MIVGFVADITGSHATYIDAGGLHVGWRGPGGGQWTSGRAQQLPSLPRETNHRDDGSPLPLPTALPVPGPGSLPLALALPPLPGPLTAPGSCEQPPAATTATKEAAKRVRRARAMGRKGIAAGGQG